MLGNRVLDIGLAAIFVGLLFFFVVRIDGGKPSSLPETADIGAPVAETTPGVSDEERGDKRGDSEVTRRVTMVSPSVSPTVTSTISVSPSPQKSPSPGPSSVSSPSPAPSKTPTPLVVVSPSPTPILSPTTTQPVGAAHVVINEIAWMGTEASQYGEWVELYNAGDFTVDLAGWGIFEASGAVLIHLSGVILPEQYFLIERTTPTSPDPIPDIVADVAVSFGAGGLNNSGERLELRDSQGIVRDIVDCSSNWYAGSNSPKTTMERIDSGKKDDSLSNWASNDGVTVNGLDAAGNPIKGTPKARNSVAR